MPRKAARDGLPGGPGGAWAAVLRRGADQVRGRGWAWGHGWAGRGAAQSPYTVTHGGNCTNRATTRRRHAVKQLLMLQNPPPARAAGTTQTRGHDKNRIARPRCLGAAATTAATPAESSRAQPWLRRAFRGPSLRCPDAPGHGPTTRLVERVPPPGRHPLPGRPPTDGYRPRATTHPDRKPTSGYLNNLSTSHNLSGCAQPIRIAPDISHTQARNAAG